MTAPSAAACRDKSIASCLISFDCPEDEWISLRTTNIVERLNKEFKRRTKPMEIMAGEAACYRLLAFTVQDLFFKLNLNPAIQTSSFCRGVIANGPGFTVACNLDPQAINTIVDQIPGDRLGPPLGELPVKFIITVTIGMTA
jgi:hypothetical protein